MKKHAKKRRFRPLKGGPLKALDVIVKILRRDGRWWYFQDWYTTAEKAWAAKRLALSPADRRVVDRMRQAETRRWAEGEMLASIGKVLAEYGVVPRADPDQEKHEVTILGRQRRRRTKLAAHG
jgi:hypothetical protein